MVVTCPGNVKPEYRWRTTKTGIKQRLAFCGKGKGRPVIEIKQNSKYKHPTMARRAKKKTQAQLKRIRMRNLRKAWKAPRRGRVRTR